MVDGERLFGNGLPLPSGPLREPVSRLASVDAAVVNGGASDRVGAPRQFPMTLGRECFVSLSGEEADPASFALASRGRRVVAVAGISNPSRFFSHLERLGVFADKRAFPDHYLYQPGDLRLPRRPRRHDGEGRGKMRGLRRSAHVVPAGRGDAAPEFDAFLRDRTAKPAPR